MSADVEIVLDTSDAVGVAIESLFHDCIEVGLEVIDETSNGRLRSGEKGSGPETGR